jgi:hypothetical protein
MARNRESVQRAKTAQLYRNVAFKYVREALDDYLEYREEQRVRCKFTSTSTLLGS